MQPIRRRRQIVRGRRDVICLCITVAKLKKNGALEVDLNNSGRVEMRYVRGMWANSVRLLGNRRDIARERSARHDFVV